MKKYKIYTFHPFIIIIIWYTTLVWLHYLLAIRLSEHSRIQRILTSTNFSHWLDCQKGPQIPFITHSRTHRIYENFHNTNKFQAYFKIIRAFQFNRIANVIALVNLFPIISLDLFCPEFPQNEENHRWTYRAWLLDSHFYSPDYTVRTWVENALMVKMMKKNKIDGWNSTNFSEIEYTMR